MLRILAVALVGTFVIAARGYALLSLGRLRAMLASNAIALAVVFAAGIPLISAHGATGGAIALAVAVVLVAGLPSLLSAALAAVVYGAALIALKVVPEEIHHAFWPVAGARR